MSASDPVHQSTTSYEKTRKDSIPSGMAGVEGARSARRCSERPEQSQPNEPINTNRTIGKIIDRLREATKLDQTIRNGVQRVEVEIKAIESWIQELRGVQNVICGNQSKPIATGDNQAILEKILENTETIKKQMNSETKTNTKTWSQIAASSLPSNPIAATQKREQPIETRRKQVKVTITDPKEKEASQNTSTQSLLNAIQVMEPKSATAEILAIGRLPSKDILLSIRTEEARLTLEHNSE